MGANQTLTYEQAVPALIEALPELQEAYKQEVDWWGGEPLAFAFIELLATAPDPRLPELVGVAICKHLIEFDRELKRARRYIGPATSEILKTVQRG